MYRSKLARLLVAFVLLSCIMVVCTGISYAEGGQPTAQATTVPVSKNIPPSSQISSDQSLSQGFAAMDLDCLTGGCRISAISSSCCNTYGYTICSPADPAVRVTIRLQAYYNGGWITLATISTAQYGTYVELSQAYNVTPGYYYRIKATHSVATGEAIASYTNGLYIG